MAAPTLSTASVQGDGKSIVLQFTADVSPMLPASGGATFTLASDRRTLGVLSVVRSKPTEFTLTTTRVVVSSETVTLNYVAGNVTDSTPEVLGTFIGAAVTNSSTIAESGGLYESRATDKVEVAQRLIEALTGLVPVFTSRIYLTADGRPPEHAIRDSELLTVQISGGQFDYGRQVGAGERGVAYQGTAVVRLWCRNESDEHGDDQQLLLSEPFGLFRVQHALLKLADSCLPGPAEDDPVLEAGIKILSDDAPERGFPEEAFGGSDGGGWGRGMLAITYGLDFVWDLSRATDAALTVVP